MTTKSKIKIRSRKTVGIIAYKINSHYALWYKKLPPDAQIYFPRPPRTPRKPAIQIMIREDIRKEIGLIESFEERQIREKELIIR